MTDDFLDDLDFDSLNADTDEAVKTPTADRKPTETPPADTETAETETSEAKTTNTETVKKPQSSEQKPVPPPIEAELPPLEGIGSEIMHSASDSRKRPLWEVLPILGGVFLVVGLFAWVLITFVFVEKPESESTLELPRNRMEAMMMELPVGEIHSHKISRNENTNKKPTVFIVEIDASIIVKGTSSELVEVEALLKSHHSRIEEVIEETVRSASDANLNEPEMIVIRTRVRDRINEFFDRPLVKEVLFGHYRAFHTPVKLGS